MNPAIVIAVFAAGLIGGGFATYLACRRFFEASLAGTSASLSAESKAAAGRATDLTTRLGRAEGELREKDQELRRMEGQNSALRTEAATFTTRVEELNRLQDRMKESFAALSSEALSATSASFFQIAKREFEGVRNEAKRDLNDKEKAIGALLDPIRIGLSKYDAKVEQLSKERDESFGKLTSQLQRVEQANVQLSQETQLLSRALRSPAVRGRWGELQLRRVLEISGMLEHCDFDSQRIVGEDGARLRPDVIIKLPGGRTVVVDAKVPLTAYLEALDAGDDEKRQQKLKAHAAQLRAHSDGLGKKAYWEAVNQSPEFVVLFLPSEVFFSAALEQDPMLIEESFSKNRVIIATPTTLIALLQSVAYGWRQESIARSAAEIAELGRELYERLSKLDDHIGNVGVHLEKAMKFYNSAVGALESRVMVSARRFKDLGVGTSVSELPILQPLEMPLRSLRSAELTDGVFEA